MTWASKQTHKPTQLNPKAKPLQPAPAPVETLASPNAQLDPQTVAPATVFQMQHTLGNVSIFRPSPPNRQGHSAPSLQAKLMIGPPRDRYEQEADRVADQVVTQINTPVLGQTVQRQGDQEEELQAKPALSTLQRQAIPEEEDLQTKSTLQRQEAIGGGEASPDLASAIDSARGNGQPLDAGLQASMGQAMGADFSGVRVHTDAQSDQLNQSIQAKAFTTGQDVFFRQGAYAPGSRGGQALIAHELTHVVQQNRGAGILQRVKVPPTGNFPRYQQAQVLVNGANPYASNDVEVATEHSFPVNSIPANPPGWNTLNANSFRMINGGGGTESSLVIVDPRIEENEQQLTRIHLIHHALAANANNNAQNIVLGPQKFNHDLVRAIEGFIGDSMKKSFSTESGGSLSTKLVAGEQLGVAGAGHPNAGMPYVAGAPPLTFPASLLTGVILPSSHGVPANAHEITTNEDILDHHRTLWYSAIPIFGLNAGNMQATMGIAITDHYMNDRLGALRTAEDFPPAAVPMYNSMALALAGSYPTAIRFRSSFFTPEPVSIPVGGCTADQMPWRDNRLGDKTVNNEFLPPYWGHWIDYQVKGHGRMEQTEQITPL